VPRRPRRTSALAALPLGADQKPNAKGYREVQEQGTGIWHSLSVHEIISAGPVIRRYQFSSNATDHRGRPRYRWLPSSDIDPDHCRKPALVEAK
jgi:hypothetical protein